MCPGLLCFTMACVTQHTWGTTHLGHNTPRAQQTWTKADLGHNTPAAQHTWTKADLGHNTPGAQHTWTKAGLGHNTPGAQHTWTKADLGHNTSGAQHTWTKADLGHNTPGAQHTWTKADLGHNTPRAQHTLGTADLGHSLQTLSTAHRGHNRFQTHQAWEHNTTNLRVCLLVGCLMSQQQASASQGRICSDHFTCCHIEIEVADQTFYLTQSQYTDTGPISPIADPITPGA